MRKLLGSALLLAVVALAPTVAAAQRRAAPRPTPSSSQKPSFGLELNWSSDVDFGIGGRGVFPLQSLFPKTPLDGIVSLDYFFPSVPSGAPAGSSAHYWEINGDVAYRFTMPRTSSLRPYAGGGLNIAHASASVGTGPTVSETKAGLNLLGGTTFRLKRSTLVPFVEARGEVGGGKTFILTGGVRF
jgi:opacity protein-like surface antigen